VIKLKSLINEIVDYEFEKGMNKTSLEEIYCFTETPIRVGKINMDILDDTGKNYNYVLKVKQFGKLIGKYGKYEIYQFTPTNDKENLNDIFVDGDLAYAYFNYRLTKNGFIEEKRIWQDRLNFGLFREIMFNYYLNKFKGVISDTAHSPNGERYWKKILMKAKNEGFKVYVLKNDVEKIPLDDINLIDKYFTNSSYKFVIEK
jgi:hypothetical protein